MTSSSLGRRRAVTLPLTLALALVSLLGAFGLPAAEAAAPPATVQPDASSGVTSDVLPTAQINTGGWVEDQAVVGDTVYAGGKFTSARPAGVAEGTSESARGNLLAYSISTGELSGFAPKTNGVVHVLALSPDQSRLYVGGEFTTVDGVTRNRLFALNTATGQVDPSFAVNLGGPVYAVTATATTVYVGGSFTQANGVNRGRFAAFRASDGGLLSSWTPKSGDFKVVRALLVAPGGNVVAGGQFGSIGNLANSTLTPAAGSASLDPTTGAAQTWNVNKVVKQTGDNGGVLSLKTDGTTVFGAGFWFGGTDSNFEGAWAVTPNDGTIKWLADCHGDTYDTTVSNGVVYAASHQHDCSNIGSFPQQRPTQVEWRANAFTADAQGDVLPNSFSPTKFKDYSTYQAPAVINWFPQFAMGPTAGYYSGQPTLTIESNSDYVVVGGQFPTVNGKAQQGLVRFARGSIAPKTDGPRLYYSDPGSANTSLGTPSVKVVGGNTIRVTAAPWDRDDAVLSKIELLRNGTVVQTQNDVTAPWWKTTVAYTDTDITAGTTYSYKLRITDADGNVNTSNAGSVTPSGTSLADSDYSRQVLADGAANYWRLDDPAAGTSITDWAGATDLARSSGLTLGAAGAVGSDTGAAVNATGNASAAASNGFVRAPQTFSAEAWFKTASTSGGQVLGFGDVPTGSSYRHDRQVYLNAAGNLVYYLDQNGTSRSITSAKSYNDNAWHQVTATLSSTSGMVLYVDGAKVASWSSITSGRAYGGFWRIGADVLPGKTATTSTYLSGSLDDVAIYPTALTAAQVKDHFGRSGRTAVATPTAAFTTACSALVCSYDASPSTADAPAARTTAAAAGSGEVPADDPSIADYAWSFGDGSSAKAAKVKHSYKKSGTFDVALTVTNSEGMVSSAIQTVDAAGNSIPVPVMTSKAKGKKLSFDGRKSVDYDGKIKKYKWYFGDGSSSTKSSVSHTYKGTGSYYVKLAVTDDDGATSWIADNVLTGGTTLASDAFQRSGTGWGNADKGGVWTTDPDAGFSLDGEQGELSLSAAGEGWTATLKDLSTNKANVVGDVTIDKTGVASGTTAAYVLREQADGDYRVKLVFVEKGKLFLVASRVVGGTEKVIKTVKVKTTYKPGDILRLRASISSAKSAAIKATVWHAGSKEPSAQLSTKDSTKSLRRAGSVGVWGYQSQSATNAPVQLSFDNLLVTPS
ncbi:hypothetical protein GCM10022197_34240 [Microlunatus spumicola]|uniref:PKD domain-containing protein n=1 Tax=Microlunatus spumicola TaxID=81499 RepID=A0ABP6XZR7_9ACTN